MLKQFPLTNVNGKIIGFIHLDNEVANVISHSHPNLSLSYNWTREQPENILMFSLIYKPEAGENETY